MLNFIICCKQIIIKQNKLFRIAIFYKLLITFLLFSLYSIGFGQIQTGDAALVKKTLLKTEEKKKIKDIVPNDTLSLHFKNDTNFQKKLTHEMSLADSMYRNAVKKSFAPKLATSGSFLIEAYATNAQNPYQLNEKQYVRADANTTLTLLGLPFNTGFYYTTESQSIYNTNKVFFSFDAHAFKDKLQQNMKDQNEALLRKHKLRNYDIAKLKAHEGDLQKKLDQLKAQIPNNSLLMNEMEKQKSIQKEKAENKMNEQREKYENKADSIKNTKEQKWRDSADHLQNRFQDSAEAKKPRREANADTALVNKYKRMEQELAALKEKREKLEALQQNDTLTKVIGFLKNSRAKKTEMMDKAQGKMKMAIATDRFDIGAINPVYSEFTSQGILLRGIDWQLSGKNVFGGFSAGRTTVNLPSLFTRTKPQFGRNFGIVTAGFGDKQKDFIAIHLMGAKDGKTDSINLSNPPIQNSVFSIEGKYAWKKNLIAEGEVAQSTYRFNNNQVKPIITVNEAPVSTSLLNQPNIAYKGKLTYKASKNTEASAQMRRINPGFKSVGNIFLRSNLLEYEFKLKQSFYKQRIKLSLFYKENKDNVFKVLETTNRMKGYGGTMNIAIPKYPILTLGYMPYEQGNNHPDTFLQTNNRFAMRFANLSYSKRIGVWNLVFSASATRSDMEIRNANLSTISNMYQSTVMAQYKNKLQSSLSYAKQTTNPGIDSLNSSSLSTRVLYSINRKMRAGLQGSGMVFKNGGYKYEGGASFEWQATQKSAFKLEGNLGKLHKIWGFDNEVMRNAMLSWLFSF